MLACFLESQAPYAIQDVANPASLLCQSSSFSYRRTLRITGRKKRSDEERGAALFGVRVHAIVSDFVKFPVSMD